MSILIIGKNSIEEKVKRERRENASIRRQIDVLEGRARATGPQRGDYKETKQYDKILSDYRNFKNPKDREKIKADYQAAQRENRRA